MASYEMSVNVRAVICQIVFVLIQEGGEYVFGSMDLALKSAWIVDFCSKLSRFTDFEYTVDRGSAVNFDVDSGLCLS